MYGMRVCTFAIGLGLMSGAASAAELKLISGFPEGFVYTTEITKPFMELVKQETGGSVTMSFTGPDAVPAFEQFEPVQSGVFDVLLTHPSYHVGTTAVGVSIDALKTDPKARREAGIIEAMDAHYRGLGMKLIAAPATGTKGFRFFLKNEIAGEPGLGGRKIRGTVSYTLLIETLGGSNVVMPGGEVYSALQTGVLDGAAWGLTGAKDFKWNEVSSYMAEPIFGQLGLMVFMNLDTWEGLTDDERAAIERAAVKLEEQSIARFDTLAAEETKALLELGMKTTSFSEKEAAQLDGLWSNGVWAVAEKTAPEEAAKLRQLARDAKLSD